MPKQTVAADGCACATRVVFDRRSQKLMGFSWQGRFVKIERVEKRWSVTRYGLLQTNYRVRTPIGLFYLAFYINPDTRDHIWQSCPAEVG
ncbi:MAG: hypothetical protein ACM3X6_09745 [Patescibacteria group bacterium]